MDVNRLSGHLLEIPRIREECFMKKFTKSLALTLIGGTICASASSTRCLADDGSHIFSLKLGVSNYLATGTRSAASRNGMVIGGRFDIPSFPLLKSLGTTSIDIDFTRNTGKGRVAEVASIDIVKRFMLAKVMYIGAGVGVHQSRVSDSTNFDEGGTLVHGRAFGQSNGVSSVNPQIGGKFLVGANLSSRFFVEGSYILNGKVAGIRTDSANVALGIHF